MRVRNSSIRTSEIGISLDRAFEIGDSATDALEIHAIREVSTLKVEIVRREVFGSPECEGAPRLDRFPGTELLSECSDDRLRDLFLDREDVGQLAIVGLGPEVIAISRIDEPDADPYAITDFPNTALEERGHSKPFT